MTGWTLLIILALAFANAWVALIGVRFRTREGMRLWANDAGYYLPVYFGFPGFYRGFYINISFAASSFALAATCLPGDSSYCGREAILVIALFNLACSFVTACLVPADFNEVLIPFSNMFWRVVLMFMAVTIIYVASGYITGNYVTALPVPAKI